jgi:hypothetical protein
MAISRLQASLASATNELTVAAAAINLDFTLFKINAPKEFHALGEHLSKNRKHDAEAGTTHVTARRLGALFENICPATPKLVKAYGTRVSEISAAATVRVSTESANSIFAAHSGVDGTSIWAAATSSSTALQLQLLACMLARVWSGPEATSVWVELIKERKTEIAALFEEEESIHFSTLKAATQLEMPRSQLADWDASARSWLRTADTVKSREQKQLMLIIDNINLPVNDDMKVYSSVIAAWKSALESMEGLINGQPQAISNGSTLLALYSWHLYPDIVVQGCSSAEVLMRDPLVTPGGVLTLGLQRRAADGRNRGVYWSLSLAHLRHYGRPVRTEGNLCNESARVTFAQFRQAAFGALLNKWQISGTGVALAAQFFARVETLFEKNARPPISPAGTPSLTRATHNIPHEGSARSSGGEGEDEAMEDFNNGNASCSEENEYSDKSAVFPEQNDAADGTWPCLEYVQDSEHWLHHLAQAAQAYLEKDDEQGKTSKLVNLGLRRPHFFGNNERVDRTPFFGLSNPETLLACLAGPEEQITYLRTIVRNMSRGPPDMVIRYFVNGGPAQYATAVPRQQKSVKRTRSTEDTHDDMRHHRWLKYNTAAPAQAMIPVGETWELQQADEFIPSRQENHFFEVRKAPGVWKEYSLFFGNMYTAALFSPTPSETSSENLIAQQEPPSAANYYQIADATTEFYAPSWVPYAPTIEDLLWCLDANLFSASRLLYQILYSVDPLGEIYRTLNALSVISRVYKLLPDATIALSALDQPLAHTQWANSMYSATASLEGRSGLGSNDKKFKFDFNLLTKGTAISCIAYLESGYCDVQPSVLSDVFALSSGDSIYVAMPVRISLDCQEYC